MVLQMRQLEKEPVIEPETVHITFTVAECGEFHNMGEYHEGIETIEEAMKLYNAIDPSRMHGIPSIGVNMHIEGTEEWEDEQADIVSGKRIDVDFLNYTPELRDTPKVQDAIKKLIAAYPEKDVIDMETKEQKIQTLAAELDQLSYDSKADIRELDFVLGYAHQRVHRAVLSEFGSVHEHHDDFVRVISLRQIIRRVGHHTVSGWEEQLLDFPFSDNVHCDISSLFVVLSLVPEVGYAQGSSDFGVRTPVSRYCSHRNHLLSEPRWRSFIGRGESAPLQGMKSFM